MKKLLVLIVILFVLTLTGCNKEEKEVIKYCKYDDNVVIVEDYGFGTRWIYIEKLDGTTLTMSTQYEIYCWNEEVGEE